MSVKTLNKANLQPQHNAYAYKRKRYYYEGEINGVTVLELTDKGSRINDARYEVNYLGCGHSAVISHNTLRSYLKDKPRKNRICRSCQAKMASKSAADMKKKKKVRISTARMGKLSADALSVGDIHTLMAEVARLANKTFQKRYIVQ